MARVLAPVGVPVHASYVNEDGTRLTFHLPQDAALIVVTRALIAPRDAVSLRASAAGLAISAAIEAGLRDTSPASRVLVNSDVRNAIDTTEWDAVSIRVDDQPRQALAIVLSRGEIAIVCQWEDLVAVAGLAGTSLENLDLTITGVSVTGS